MRPIAHRARLATTTNTRAFAANLLQMQPTETIDSSIDCGRGPQETSPFTLAALAARQGWRMLQI
jgi:hypothetical protein